MAQGSYRMVNGKKVYNQTNVVKSDTGRIIGTSEVIHRTIVDPYGEAEGDYNSADQAAEDMAEEIRKRKANGE